MIKVPLPHLGQFNVAKSTTLGFFLLVLVFFSGTISKCIYRWWSGLEERDGPSRTEGRSEIRCSGLCLVSGAGKWCDEMEIHNNIHALTINKKYKK